MTDKEINKLKDSLPKWDEQNEEEKKLDKELSCREMINSILIYGYLNNTVDEIFENKYLRGYKDDISESRIKELIKEQQNDLKKSKINSDVYTDDEGVSYNSVTWYDEDEDVKEESLFNKSKNISNTDISELNTNLISNNEKILNKLQPKLTEGLGDRYQVWQKYYEDEMPARAKYVMSFDTFEEANKFVEGLMEDPDCTAWVVDTELNESKESNSDNQYYIDRLNELQNQYKSGYGEDDEEIEQEVIRLLDEIPNGFEAYRVSKETNSGWTAYGSYHDEYTVLVPFIKENGIWKYNNRKKDDVNDAMLSVLYNSGEFMTKEEAEAKKKEQEKDDVSYHRDIVNVGTDQWGNPIGKSTNRIHYSNREDESKELRKYNSRLYGIYDKELKESKKLKVENNSTELEQRMDKIAKDMNYFDDMDEEYNTHSKDLWLNKYTFKDKWNELEAHFEPEDLYSQLNGVNGAKFDIDDSGKKVVIRLYRYPWYKKAHLKEIREILKGKIDGNVSVIGSSDSDYKSVGMKFTINNLENYPKIQQIVDKVIQEINSSKKEESKELRKYNSRLYGVYDTEKEEYEEVGSLEDMKEKIRSEKDDIKEEPEKSKEDKKDININITVKNENKEKLSFEEIVLDSYQHLLNEADKKITLENLFNDIINNYEQDYIKDDTIEDMDSAFRSIVYVLNHNNIKFELDENITVKNESVELSNEWKEKLGDNVHKLPEYEFRALRYAEINGITDYDIDGNKMIWLEKLPHEGIFEHILNLDIMKESTKQIINESLEEESVKLIINPKDKFYKDNHLWVVYLYPGAGVEMVPYYVYADYEQDALEILIPYLLDNAPGLVYDIQELEEEFLDDYIIVDGIHYLDYNTKVEELFGNEKDKIETEFFKNYKEEE